MQSATHPAEHIRDPELQQVLARDGLAALDQLLSAQPAGELIDCGRVGALVRLIAQAEREGRLG